jgi:hypothetical protein
MKNSGLQTIGFGTIVRHTNKDKNVVQILLNILYTHTFGLALDSFFKVFWTPNDSSYTLECSHLVVGNSNGLQKKPSSKPCHIYCVHTKIYLLKEASIHNNK